MKRAEMLKLAKANGVVIPFGSKTHEALKILKDAGVEIPGEVEADMAKVVVDAKAKEKAAWAAAQDDGDEDVQVAAEVPSESPVEAVKRASESPDGLAELEKGRLVDGEGRVYDDIGQGLRRGPVGRVSPKDEAFAHLFNSLEPGRGYTLRELSEMAGFGVTDGHFAQAAELDIAFPKSGGRWVRRPKNLGEHLL